MTIEIKNLSKNYNNILAVKNINFTINKGTIVGLLGPNGCGKTNIVDAIRWVLGEQRTSKLRSSKMEDVIFKRTFNFYKR